MTGERNGLGDAMLRGLAAALALSPSAVVTLDGDGQHNPFDIPTLYRAFDARGADIAIGSRWTRGGSAPGTSPARTVGSRVGNWLFRSITGTRGVKDATTSFRVYSPGRSRFLLPPTRGGTAGYSFFSTTIALAEAAGLGDHRGADRVPPALQRPLQARAGTEVWRYFRSLPELREERRRLMAERRNVTGR